MKEIEFIKKVNTSVCEYELTRLSNSPYSNVRVAVAKNNRTPAKVLNYLAFDPTSRVIYHALKNQKWKIKRNIDESHKCITCNVDEINNYSSCENCEINYMNK